MSESICEPPSKESLDFLYARAKGICFVCKLPVARKHASREHIIPVSIGGTDHVDNLTISHKRCNSKRGNGYRPIYSKHHTWEVKSFKLLEDHGLLIQIIPEDKGAYIIVSKKKED